LDLIGVGFPSFYVNSMRKLEANQFEFFDNRVAQWFRVGFLQLLSEESGELRVGALSKCKRISFNFSCGSMSRCFAGYSE
jgi:hypothetical protein